MQILKDFEQYVQDIESQAGYEKPLAFGIGIRRRRKGKTLDVLYPVINHQVEMSLASVMIAETKYTAGRDGFAPLTQENLDHLYALFAPFQKDFQEAATIRFLQSCTLQTAAKHPYHDVDYVLYFLYDPFSRIDSVEEAYFKLQAISQRHFKPHGLGLENLFSILPNLAWTNRGPMLPQDVEQERVCSVLAGNPLIVSHVDKFPYLVNYHVPNGVRIAAGSQVRLGAYLGEGTTIMPSGFVNFNAGTEGKAMVEGRISAGVFVGNETDIGGGASIMGTLSGGNKNVISIGAKCLLGANSGTGISLGFACTIAAGTYVTAGSKVALYNAKNDPVDLDGRRVEDGQNVVKALELSGRDNLLFYQDSQTGRLVCKPNAKTIELNPGLHSNV